MINNKTDIIGYMQLFFKFWPIGSPDEAYYMEYKGDFSKPLNEDFFQIHSRFIWKNLRGTGRKEAHIRRKIY